jgi:hypothetical protein
LSISEQWGRFQPEHTTTVSVLDRLLHHAVAVVTELAGDRAWGRPPPGLVPLAGAGQAVDLDSLRFLGAKMASYGLVRQEPDAAAAVYTES